MKKNKRSRVKPKGKTLSQIEAIIFNLMIKDIKVINLNRIRPEVDLILWKNQNGFRTNRSTPGKILTIRRIQRVKTKNLPITLLFIDFSRAFDLINSEKMNIILRKYGIPTEIIIAANDAVYKYSLYDQIYRWGLESVNEIH